MAWTNYQILLALLMVVTGSINTLATSWADRIESLNSIGQIKKFNHPFLQACGMFLGEFSCLLVFRILLCTQKKETASSDVTHTNSGRFNPLIFLPPALCDLTGTSIMYIGLNLTYAASFQMLRGAVIVFTGLLSVAFLGRKLKNYEWLGIFLVIAGLACVGASDIINPDKSKAYPMNNIITGDLLIIMAQIIVATQMVVEEKFVGKYNVPPLQGVGWEGLFGFVILGILLIPMYYIKVGNSVFDSPYGRLEDALDAFTQISNSWQLIVAISGTVVSIAFFNFAGLSVTKEMSATTRMVLDSIRTFTVWAFSLLIGWQSFYWLQLVGFLILFCGMCLYNDVIIRPLYLKYRYSEVNERQPLLRSSDEEYANPIIKTRGGSINA